MKVLLINPPNTSKNIRMIREGRCMQRRGAWTTVWAPITLATSAAILRENGFEVKIIDSSVEDINLDEICQVCNQDKPQLVVINTGTPSIESDLGFAQIVKNLDIIDIKVAAIGVHVTVLPQECLQMQKNLDFIIRNEPELTIKELAEALRSKSDISKIKGISYRLNGRIVHNPDREFFDNLDDFPFPAWDLVNINKYIMPFKNKPFLLVSTGKGCPYNCIFCNAKPYYGNKVRLRSPLKVVDEVAWIIEKFNIRDFFFWSETFTLNNKYVYSICDEIISRGLDIAWVCNSRVDTVSLELLKTLKKAGCWMISYGIESGEQRILDKAKKNITIQQIEQAVKWAKEAGLEVTAHAIFGLPGETRQSIKNTVNFLKKLDVDFVQIYCAVPFPGSELFGIAKDNKWILRNEWEFFEQNFSIMDMGTITAKEIMELRRKAMIDFYLQPRVILKTFFRIKSFRDIKIVPSILKEFLSWV